MSVTVRVNEVVSIVPFGRWTTGYEVRNVFYFQNLQLADQSIHTEDVRDWMHMWFDEINQDVSKEFCYYQVQVTNLSRWESETFVLDPVVAGLAATEPLPLQIAALITLYTDAKRKIGKKYFAGYTEVTQSGGILTASALENLEDCADKLTQGFRTGMVATLDPVLFTRKDGTTARVKSAAARQILATQRRRKPGVGI